MGVPAAAAREGVVGNPNMASFSLAHNQRLRVGDHTRVFLCIVMKPPLGELMFGFAPASCETPKKALASWAASHPVRACHALLQFRRFPLSKSVKILRQSSMAHL